MTQAQDIKTRALGALETADFSDGRAARPRGGHRPFEFVEFFSGKTLGWGFFQDRFKRQRLTFSVEMFGKETEGRFVLDETFVYGDGRVAERRWQIERRGIGLYEARADDVVGAASGVAIEGGVRWRYVMGVPIADRVVNLSFDDRFFGQTDDYALNLSDASKWGFRIGRLCALFTRI